MKDESTHPVLTLPQIPLVDDISIRVLDSVASTMDVARDEVLRGRAAFDSHGRSWHIGFLAREQTAGRGQRGRAWFVPYNEALCVTYILRDGLADPANAALLALLVGVGVADTVREMVADSAALNPEAVTSDGSDGSVRSVGHKRCDIGLKWPNDILLNGKKVGGVLIESLKAPDEGWVALVGVGLNLTVREFPPELRKMATSFALEGLSASTDSPEIVAANIFRSLLTLIALAQTGGVAAVLARWREYDRTPDRHYVTEQEGRQTEGVAIGIDENGALLLRLVDGTIRAVSSASSLREMGHDERCEARR